MAIKKQIEMPDVITNHFGRVVDFTIGVMFVLNRFLDLLMFTMLKITL